MAKKSLKDVKVNNTAQVLECIIKHSEISRIEISEKTGLSPSTVSQAVALLMEKGLTEELKAGESTGGRKPILLRVRPEYGSILTIEIKRSGVDAQIFDLAGRLLDTQTLSKRKLSGNGLLETIGNFARQVREGQLSVPARIVGIGLLCQDDIPEYDLNVEYSVSLSSDVVSLEKVLASEFHVPVKKELIRRYSLDYYLKAVDAQCSDYAYINIGERITASFVLNKTLVHNSSDSVFDVSSAVLSGSYAGNERQESQGKELPRANNLERIPLERLTEKLVQVIKSALLFFPVHDVFIGGQSDQLDTIVERVAGEFAVRPVVRKANMPGEHVNHAFAYQILAENYRQLIGAR